MKKVNSSQQAVGKAQRGRNFTGSCNKVSKRGTADHRSSIINCFILVKSPNLAVRQIYTLDGMPVNNRVPRVHTLTTRVNCEHPIHLLKVGGDLRAPKSDTYSGSSTLELSQNTPSNHTAVVLYAYVYALPVCH